MIEQLSGPINFLWVQVEEYLDYKGVRHPRLDELSELADAGRIRKVEMRYDHHGMYVTFLTPGEPDTRPRCAGCGERYDYGEYGWFCSFHCKLQATAFEIGVERDLHRSFCRCALTE